MKSRICKSCSRSFIASNEAIEELVKEQLQLESNLVNDSIYNERLKVCDGCSSLINGTTCNHCGCFVQFRAKLPYKKCPHPEGAKWERVS
jgi:hypothetical protein